MLILWQKSNRENQMLNESNKKKEKEQKCLKLGKRKMGTYRRKYFTLQCIHLCVWHKTEITLGCCPLKMLFCSILFFSVLSWFTNDESWSPKWKPLLYNNAGKRKTTFSHPHQLKFQVFPVLQTQCRRVAFAISAAKHAVEVFGLSWQCQQRFSH